MKWEYKTKFIALLFNETEDAKDFIGHREKQFSYLWEKKLQAELNKIGDEGWEIVTIEAGLINGEAVCGYALLKRPKNDN